MKSYGKVDSSWDHAKFQSILEDALDLVKKHDVAFCLGKDKNGNVSLLPNTDGNPIDIFACMITPVDVPDEWLEQLGREHVRKRRREQFWDNGKKNYYTIDEIVPRVYDCLVNGVIEYGALGILSEGKDQLEEVIGKAEKMLEKHGKPLIVGLNKDEIISICPVSEKSRFYAPMALLYTKSGCWSISEMHSDRIHALMLYEAITYHRKFYTRTVEKHYCIAMLESALEDAINMPGDRIYELIMYDGKIDLAPMGEHLMQSANFSFEINPKKFWEASRGVLSRERISTAARDIYEKYSQIKNRA